MTQGNAFRRDEKIEKTYGAHFFEAGAQEILDSKASDPYRYQLFVGQHVVTVEAGDCAYWLSEDRLVAHLNRGPCQITSQHFLAIVRGFAPENKTSTITRGTVLPYINGASTKQIFPPDRPGDPTLQLLLMPPHTMEQAHHIHSTARLVYVLEGSGISVVGQKGNTSTHVLKPGTVIALDRMCPHHFKSFEENLLVMPLHVWSSTGRDESNHPMFNGTFQIG
jgi:mannose-6-phosphate isomerase-like protein (cupin superfamily)